MTTIKRKLTKREVSQTFNLKELFADKIDAKTFRQHKSDIANELFAQVYDKMTERTAKGKDINGSKFEKYSKKYAEFKGVPRNKVDMELYGDMLNSIKDQLKGNELKIKVDGKKEILKSFNHCTGDTLPTRDFFGVNEKELNSIVKSIAKDFKKSNQSERNNSEIRPDIQIDDQLSNNIKRTRQGTTLTFEVETNA